MVLNSTLFVYPIVKYNYDPFCLGAQKYKHIISFFFVIIIVFVAALSCNFYIINKSFSRLLMLFKIIL